MKIYESAPPLTRHSLIGLYARQLPRLLGLPEEIWNNRQEKIVTNTGQGRVRLSHRLAALLDIEVATSSFKEREDMSNSESSRAKLGALATPTGVITGMNDHIERIGWDPAEGDPRKSLVVVAGIRVALSPFTLEVKPDPEWHQAIMAKNYPPVSEVA